jgi:tetratricopeptide (TPR) repeat protein
MSQFRVAVLWLVRIAALAGLTLAAVWSFRVAAADQCVRAFTIASIGQAIAWTPDQSINYVRLSALVSDTDPTRAAQALDGAVALNPMDARSWIDLALRCETEGDLRRAERYLLRAAEVDHQYLPSWSLANFYFRQNDAPRFWLWARKAAGMLYGDPALLFRLAGAVSEDGNLVERLNLRNPELRAAYLNYVLARDNADLIHPVGQRVLTDGREQDVPLLLAACDRLLDLKRVDEAIEVWNRLASARRIPYGSVSPSTGAVLTNGDFSSSLSSHGFDWRVPDINGVSAANEDAPGGIRLTFSGRQPESCVPLSQFIPVRENTHYEVQYRYSTSGIADGSGLSWNLEFTDVSEPATITAQIPSDEKEGSRIMTFDSPPGCHLVRLSLAYRRAPGTTRIEGRIVLRQVRLRQMS